MVEITRLFWKRALTSDNFVLGEVESTELDQKTWQITNLYIGLTDDATQTLGFKLPFLGKVVFCLPVGEVKTIQDNTILNKKLNELRNLKQCKEKNPKLLSTIFR